MKETAQNIVSEVSLSTEIWTKFLFQRKNLNDDCVAGDCDLTFWAWGESSKKFWSFYTQASGMRNLSLVLEFAAEIARNPVRSADHIHGTDKNISL